MDLLGEFFRILAGAIGDALAYMVNHLFDDPSYRRGFFAGIVFIVVAFGLSQLIPYAQGRIVAFFAVRQPTLQQEDSGAVLGGGCALGTVILLGLAIIFGGIMWGLGANG
jgi:hypothetical protein